jgi:hypothetical protein
MLTRKLRPRDESKWTATDWLEFAQQYGYSITLDNDMFFVGDAIELVEGEPEDDCPEGFQEPEVCYTVHLSPEHDLLPAALKMLGIPNEPV